MFCSNNQNLARLDVELLCQDRFSRSRCSDHAAHLKPTHKPAHKLTQHTNQPAEQLAKPSQIDIFHQIYSSSHIKPPSRTSRPRILSPFSPHLVRPSCYPHTFHCHLLTLQPTFYMPIMLYMPIILIVMSLYQSISSRIFQSILSIILRYFAYRTGKVIFLPAILRLFFLVFAYRGRKVHGWDFCSFFAQFAYRWGKCNPGMFFNAHLRWLFYSIRIQGGIRSGVIIFQRILNWICIQRGKVTRGDILNAHQGQSCGHFRTEVHKLIFSPNKLMISQPSIITQLSLVKFSPLSMKKVIFAAI